MRKYICSLIIFVFIFTVTQCTYSNDRQIPDNLEYKEWCKETFENGKYIYKGYKDISFNIKYTPEEEKIDVWQTPFETKKSKKGDCEDAVFVFFSHLPQDCRNAEIVWGWVIDKQIGVAKAHVWYQLTDKEKNTYVVEGSSNDWNGIIPMKIIEQTESRKPIFVMPHTQASILLSRVWSSDSWGVFQELADLHKPSDFVDYSRNDRSDYKNLYTGARIRIPDELRGMSPRLKLEWLYSAREKAKRMEIFKSKEIQKIFKKLHELFTRYDMQK